MKREPMGLGGMSGEVTLLFHAFWDYGFLQGRGKPYNSGHQPGHRQGGAKRQKEYAFYVESQYQNTPFVVPRDARGYPSF